MKEISASEVKAALKEIFRIEKPKLISTDQGTSTTFFTQLTPIEGVEFLARDVQDLLKHENIKFYPALQPPHKAR
jgi:hypothetical protein